MELKRHYRFPAGWKPDYNVSDLKRVSDANPLGLKDPERDEGVVLNPPQIDHFEIRHTGNHEAQNFSEGLVEAGRREGFLTFAQGKITLKCKPEDLNYKILRGPGYYCCHCGKQLQDANFFIKNASGEQTKTTRGMQHVETVHKGAKSPDLGNPAGYRRVSGYECELDAAQHRRFSFAEYRKKRMGRKHG
jgi:hypothetical protein